MNGQIFLGLLSILFLHQAAAQVVPTKETELTLDPTFLQLRDPFLQPSMNTRKKAETPVLERYAVKNFKLLAILDGINGSHALLADPTGKTHTVKERLKIGLNKGFIDVITKDQIEVVEFYTNLGGFKQRYRSILKIEPKVDTKLEQNQPPVESSLYEKQEETLTIERDEKKTQELLKRLMEDPPNPIKILDAKSQTPTTAPSSSPNQPLATTSPPPSTPPQNSAQPPGKESNL